MTRPNVFFCAGDSILTAKEWHNASTLGTKKSAQREHTWYQEECSMTQ